MAVMWWWLGAALVVALVVVGVAGWWRASHADARRDAPSDKGERREFWVAHADRLRGLPRFQRLVAQRLRWGRLTLVGLAVAAVGAGLLGARVVGVSNDDELMRNRDVMLCLDVSASMAPVDTSVVRSYQRISGKLDTDRLGLVAFDSSAVVLFPLTSDAGFVQAHLSDAATRVGDIDHEPIAGTRIAGLGSSLVGDGLASCTSRFNQLDQPRSRTIVLATDGLVSGQAVYSITQAADAARSKGIMVFVVAPDNDDADALATLRAAAQATGGQLLTISPGRTTNTNAVTSAVQAQQRRAIRAANPRRSFDRPEFGAALVCVGLALVTLARWRQRP